MAFRRHCLARADGVSRALHARKCRAHPVDRATRGDDPATRPSTPRAIQTHSAPAARAISFPDCSDRCRTRDPHWHAALHRQGERIRRQPGLSDQDGAACLSPASPTSCCCVSRRLGGVRFPRAGPPGRSNSWPRCRSRSGSRRSSLAAGSASFDPQAKRTPLRPASYRASGLSAGCRSGKERVS